MYYSKLCTVFACKIAGQFMNTAAQCILIPQIRYTFLSTFNLRAFTAELILPPTLAELIKKFIMLGFYVPSVLGICIMPRAKTTAGCWGPSSSCCSSFASPLRTTKHKLWSTATRLSPVKLRRCNIKESQPSYGDATYNLRQFGYRNILYSDG